MRSVWKLLKINILSIAAILLLLPAVVVKLAAKILKKTQFLLGVVLALIATIAVFRILRDPVSVLQGIFEFLLLFCVAGIAVGLVILILSIISSISMTVIEAVIGLFESIYESMYSWYTKLFELCQSDFKELCSNRNQVLIGIVCFCYIVLRLFNQSLIFFISHALKFFILFGGIVLGGSVYLFHSEIVKELGISLFAYLKLFPIFDLLYAAVLYLVVIGGSLGVLISLGLDWSEWGAEMRLETSAYIDIKSKVKKREMRDTDQIKTKEEQKRTKEFERCRQYLNLLEQHLKGFDYLSKEVAAAVEETQDSKLQTEYHAYLSELQELAAEFSEYQEGVPTEVIQEWIPIIQQLEQRKKTLSGFIEQNKTQKKPDEQAKFFAGCDTEEKLEKRYRALCKTYHPDGEAGDEQTFVRMKAEYDERKRSFS